MDVADPKRKKGRAEQSMYHVLPKYTNQMSSLSQKQKFPVSGTSSPWTNSSSPLLSSFS